MTSESSNSLTEVADSESIQESRRKTAATLTTTEDEKLAQITPPPPHPENISDLEKATDAVKVANVSWDGDDDPECPYNFPIWKKLMAMFVICTASICV